MKGRLLVAAVGIPLLMIILFLCPPVTTAVAIALLSAIGARELLQTTGVASHKGMIYASMVMAFLVPIWSYLGSGYFRYLEPQILTGAIGVFVFAVLLFVFALSDYPNSKFSSVTGCLFAGIVIPLCLSSISRILCGNEGRYYVLVPILVAFAADAGAYFAGRFLGKHKMAPVLSPKKTWEGAVGGLITNVTAMVIYGLIMQFAFGFTFRYGFGVIYGLVGGLISIIGDLSFSMVKRETGIKDYGTIFRAHGGVLDRFDSVVFAAPLTELMILLMPLLGE